MPVLSSESILKNMIPLDKGSIVSNYIYTHTIVSNFIYIYISHKFLFRIINCKIYLKNKIVYRFWCLSSKLKVHSDIINDTQ